MRILRALVPLTCTLAILGASPASADDGTGSGSAVASSGSGSSAGSDAPATVPTAPIMLPVVDGDDIDLGKQVYRGITEKNWFLAVGAALALLTHAVRWLLMKKWPSWDKDRWAWALAGGMAGVVALSMAWMADASASSADTWLGALKLFATSVFTYVTTKKVAFPSSSASAPSSSI